MDTSHELVQPELLDRIAVLIPAWKPDERLVALVQALSILPFAAILVVNDGSGPEYERHFQQAGAVARTVVLRHSRNRGQGRAVKTAMEYVVANLPNVTGIVTADADGQHAVTDILGVADALSRSHGRPVLGTRIFGAGVPLRSRFGNVITQYVFRVLSGTMIVDTQSGLRGIPRQWLETAIEVPGDRFEFAISLLARLCRRGAVPVQVPIATIYIDENRSSHFRPVRDSIRIYLFLLRIYALALLPACVDLGAFLLAYVALHAIGMSVLAGRLIAGVTVLLEGLYSREVAVDFKMRMLTLALTGLVAWGGISALAQGLHWNVVVSKVAIEAALWIVLDLAGLRRPATVY
jgi:glycosyltransferase involved in cell wall biosynthesis